MLSSESWQVDVVFDDHDITDFKVWTNSSWGIRHQHSLHPHQLKDPDGECHLRDRFKDSDRHEGISNPPVCSGVPQGLYSTESIKQKMENSLSRKSHKNWQSQADNVPQRTQVLLNNSPGRGSNLHIGGSGPAWRHRGCPQSSQTPDDLHDPELRQNHQTESKIFTMLSAESLFLFAAAHRGRGLWWSRGRVRITCADGEVRDVLIPEGLFVGGSVSEQTKS